MNLETEYARHMLWNEFVNAYRICFCTIDQYSTRVFRKALIQF